MPKIVIKEYDNTKPGLNEYSNFTVVVPGWVSTESGIREDCFDENGIYECSSQREFKTNVGKVATSDDTPGMGNKIAWELLGLGYTILYKKLDATTEYGTGAKKGIAALDTAEFWESLKDKANYDFRYVVTGKLTNNTEANNRISELCTYNNSNPDNTGRGDCVALVDIDESAYTADSVKTQSQIINAIKTVVNGEESGFAGLTSADKYTGIFAPTVEYEDYADTKYNNSLFPASFHYLACAAEACATYPEWFAVAGHTRGKNSTFKIAKGLVVLGEAAINALEPRTEKNDVKKAVNVIARIKGNYYIWGNRTAHKLGTEGTDDGELVASHFLNIRQLCTTLKKQLYINCRKFTFDPNSDVLWVNFCNAIEPLLNKMKANQGIEDYSITKVVSKKKATLHAIIRIVPIEAVEDFEINLTLEDSIEGYTAEIAE